MSNGEALSQAVKFKLCFAICCLIWTLAGFFFGQVRTLQKFGWLANAAVWINVVCMIVTMGAAAHTAPNYLGAASSAGATLDGGLSVTPDQNTGVFPPVQHSAGLPPSNNFAGTVNGAMQAVFSYGGAMIFPEFMSEMRYPRDFLKGMWAAQAFIYLVYMFYGLFIYGYQGMSFASRVSCVIPRNYPGFHHVIPSVLQLTALQANMLSIRATLVSENTVFRLLEMSLR